MIVGRRRPARSSQPRARGLDRRVARAALRRSGAATTAGACASPPATSTATAHTDLVARLAVRRRSRVLQTTAARRSRSLTRPPRRPGQQPQRRRLEGRAARRAACASGSRRPPPRRRPAPADVVFGLGARTGADAVRVLWPAGILQTEIPRRDAAPTRAAALAIKELDRKPSSCPYLYAWNGRAFEFITDFMGGGEMGYWEAPGRLQPARPRRIRAHLRRPAPAARRPLRAARDQRARGGALRRPPVAARGRASRRRRDLSRTKGMRDRPRRASGSCACATRGRRWRRRRTSAATTCSTASRALDRRFVDDFALLRDPRLRRGAHAHARSRPFRRRAHACCS